MERNEAVQLASVAPAWNAALPQRPLSGLTVLMVEDSRYASEAMRLLCLRSGARIRRADCLRTADRHLQTYSPSVVIIDMGLPDGDGAQLIRKIAKARPRVHVLLGISGDPERRQDALDAGADGFIEKPFHNLAEFQQMLLAMIPGSQRPRGLRLLPDEVVAPDHAALCEDLSHVAEILNEINDTSSIGYVARFLAGIARSSKDRILEDAAAALERDHSQGRSVATDLSRISGLVQDRLAGVSGSA